MMQVPLRDLLIHAELTTDRLQYVVTMLMILKFFAALLMSWLRSRKSCQSSGQSTRGLVSVGTTRYCALYG
jgi:hypothetical protein